MEREAKREEREDGRGRRIGSSDRSDADEGTGWWVGERKGHVKGVRVWTLYGGGVLIMDFVRVLRTALYLQLACIYDRRLDKSKSDTSFCMTCHCRPPSESQYISIVRLARGIP